MRQGKRQLDKRDDCALYEQDLVLYLHDALPAGSRRRVATHLRGCAACRKRLADYTRASEALAGAVRGNDLPPWNPSPSVRPSPGSRIPWYAPLLILLLAGSITLLWWGGGTLMAHKEQQGGAPTRGFREKVLTHNRDFMPMGERHPPERADRLP